jgi:hypothetical protein
MDGICQIHKDYRGRVWKKRVENGSYDNQRNRHCYPGSCSGTDKTEISGDYGEGTNLYEFTIPIPPCKVTSTNGTFLGEDGSQILVDNQIGNNPTIMKGSIIEKKEGTVTTWKWDFVKK